MRKDRMEQKQGKKKKQTGRVCEWTERRETPKRQDEAPGKAIHRGGSRA